MKVWVFSERTSQPGIMPRRMSPRALLAFGSVCRGILPSWPTYSYRMEGSQTHLTGKVFDTASESVTPLLNELLEVAWRKRVLYQDVKGAG